MVNDLKKLIIRNKERVPLIAGVEVIMKDLHLSKFYHSRPTDDAKVLFFCTYKDSVIGMLKMMRGFRYNWKLKKECEGQRHVRGTLSADLIVPEVYFSDTVNEHFTYMEEIISGEAIGKVNSLQVLSKLYKYQEGVFKGDTRNIKDIKLVFQSAGIVDEDFMDFLSQLNEGVICRAKSHGDLTYMNVIQNGSQTAIIDWENYGERNIWGIDYIHYFVRAHGINNLEEFDNKSGILPNSKNINWRNIYLIDRLFDILQKRYPEHYKNVFQKI